MTESISHFSRFSDAKVDAKNGKNNYTGEKRRNAGQKLNFFYNTVSFVVLGFALFVLIVSNLGDRVAGPNVDKKDIPAALELQKKSEITPKVIITPDSKK